jgi:NADH-quinone oxidoreductase subunit A
MALDTYLPLLAALIVGGLLGAAMLAAATFLGPKHTSVVKSSTFECGSTPVGTARQRFAVKFYVVALLFIVFDLEAVFLYPWAVEFKSLGWFGFFEMLAFAATLLVGLVYVWRKGALDWE